MTDQSAAAAGSPSTATPPVLCLGETLIDLIVADEAPTLEQASAFVARPGGAPANVAVALARLGVPSAFAGVVGDDPFGRRLRSGLAAEGVDAARLRSTPDAETTLAFAWKDNRGDGHFRLLRGADTHLSVADTQAAGIEDMAAVVVGSVALAAHPSRSAITHAAAIAARKDVPLCFDVNARPTLWSDPATARQASEPLLQRAALIKLSLDDARYLFGAGDDPVAAVELLRSPSQRGSDDLPGQGTPQIVLTDGSRGCWYASAHGNDPVRHVPAFTVDAVEPTGAGDAFTAALLRRLVDRRWTPLDDADLRYAAAAGALATTRRGAWEGQPTAAELDAFLATH